MPVFSSTKIGKTSAIKPYLTYKVKDWGYQVRSFQQHVDKEGAGGGVSVKGWCPWNLRAGGKGRR